MESSLKQSTLKQSTLKQSSRSNNPETINLEAINLEAIGLVKEVNVAILHLEATWVYTLSVRSTNPSDHTRRTE
ncbi:hypothetical protein VA249_31570 [Vibrio alfacsensis]|nr:hypothetical protein VA249_31570 [Vibrio alfacsensis]